MARLSKEEIDNFLNSLIKKIDEKGVMHLSVPEIIRQENVSRTIAQILYNKLLEYIINNPDKYIISKLGNAYLIVKKNVATEVNKTFLQGIIFSLSLLYKVNKDMAIQLLNTLRQYSINVDINNIITDDNLLMQILNEQLQKKQ